MRAFSGVWMAIVAVSVGVFAGMAHAEWTTQEIVLQPGWNAVFLLVQPAENKCEQVFAEMPVKSVWAWVKRFTSVQFVQNPEDLLPEMPDWLTYFPPSHPQAFLTDLFALHAGRCYLIDLDGTEPRTLVLEGKTEIRKMEWIPNSFNLAGFYIDPAAPPTFQRFFASDTALADQVVYRTLTNGKNEVLGDLASARLRAGEAYWVYCKGASSFSGPLKVDFDLREGLDYGKDITEHALRLKNVSAEERTVTVRLQPATRPVKSVVKGGLPAGGGVALSFMRLLAWRPLEEPLVFSLAPGMEQDLRLAVRRAAMKQPGVSEAVYESLLEVSDNRGSFFKIPVSAKAGDNTAGLWVGNVKVNAVSEAGNAADPVTPAPASSEFTFRIIVHVDASGTGRLLRHVTLMQVQAVLEPDPANPGQYIQTAPSRYVLLSNDTLIPQYEGISMRDGKMVGRRITAPVFGFRDPVLMTGGVATALEATLSMPYDDALNPFLHRYHPDHDNKDERYSSTPLAEGKESFTFSRAIRLEFSAEDPEDIDPPEWGDKLLGGIYRETISGMHKRDLHVQGTFLLTRIVDVALLNDGN